MSVSTPKIARQSTSTTTTKDAEGAALDTVPTGGRCLGPVDGREPAPSELASLVDGVTDDQLVLVRVEQDLDNIG